MKQIKMLNIKGYLNIEELEIEAGKINIISGGNESGKTSILDALGQLFRNSVEKPRLVNDNSDKAELMVELDDEMKVKRIINKSNKTTTLNAITKEGFKATSPSKALESMFSEFAYLPRNFMKKDIKEQTKIILNLIDMELDKEKIKEIFGECSIEDFSKHGLEIFKQLEDLYYKTRATVNGEVKSLKEQITLLDKKIPNNYQVEDYRNINPIDKYEEYRNAVGFNAILVEKQNFINTVEEKIIIRNNEVDAKIIDNQNYFDRKFKELDDSLVNAEAELEKMILLKKAEIFTLKENIGSLCNNKTNADDEVRKEANADIEIIKSDADVDSKFIKDNKIVDLEVLDAEYKNLTEMKGLVQTSDSLSENFELLKAKELEAKSLTKKVALARNKPLEMLKAIDMPINGLALDDSGNIVIDGFPLANLSSGKLLLVVVKIAQSIIRKNKDGLNVICIDGFEQLDLNNRTEFLKAIEIDDFQYFITQVGEGERVVETK